MKIKPLRSFMRGSILLIYLILSSSMLLADVFVAGLNAIDRSHYASAYRSFKPLAENGVAEAQNNLGFLYQNGFGVKRNYNTAIKWYELAADQGLPEAQHNMGMLNYWGYGLSQSYSHARRWFTKSANQGLSDSHYMIGLIFFKGEGTQVSPERAKQHFTKAAQSGDSNAQYMLAHMIASGDAKSNYKTPGNRLSPFDFALFTESESNQLVAALTLSLLASRNGQDMANQLAEYLNYQLDNEEIAEAQELSERCLESAYRNCPIF
ncbi:MAG: sel1 repeat family protein [Gammaproteobacteria bacterium TMED1]|nr:MAG: sel1 repeat family protein [Gammaproteobacteria bacterium TMED1]